MTTTLTPDLTPDVVAAMLARCGGIDAVREQFMTSGSYRLTPIGELAGRYLDDLRFENYSENTIAGRLQTLSCLAFDHLSEGGSTQGVYRGGFGNQRFVTRARRCSSAKAHT